MAGHRLRRGRPTAQDGIFVPGMTVCVESYIGETGGLRGSN